VQERVADESARIVSERVKGDEVAVQQRDAANLAALGAAKMGYATRMQHLHQGTEGLWHMQTEYVTQSVLHNSSFQHSKNVKIHMSEGTRVQTCGRKSVLFVLFLQL